MVVPLLVGCALVPRLDGESQLEAGIGGVVRYASGHPAPDIPVVIAAEGSVTVATVRSDAEGSFTVSGLRPGTYSLTADDGRHEPFVRAGIMLGPGEVRRQDVALDASARVQGRVPDAVPSAVAPTPTPIRDWRISTVAQAQEGARSGALLPQTGTDGTNEFHGSMYHLLGHEGLNARGFFGRKGKWRENRFGLYIGGPVRKNRTYFTYHYDRRSLRSGPRSGFGNSAPVAAFRRGDFSRLLTGRPLASDALGRPLLEGQLFDPASGFSVRGAPVRDPLPNNAIPASHPLRSRVSQQLLALVPQPERPGLEFNAQGNPFGEQVWILDAPSHFARVDHALGDDLRAGISASRTSHPAVGNCGGLGGCGVSSDPILEPEGNARYYGTGVYEDITTHHVRQRLDWIAGPNLLSQGMVGYEEFHVTGHALSAGAGWPERLWGPAGNGLVASDAGPPALRFTGNTRYSPLGSEQGRAGFQASHQFRAANTLSWFRGRHALRVAAEFRRHVYAFRGWATNVAGQFEFHRRHTGGFDAAGNNLPGTGDPFASFLLGQANSTRFQIPDMPTLAERFVSWSAVDEVDLSARVTVTFGVRFDYQTAMRESSDNLATFDPKVSNPGAAGRLGAMVFAGTGPGRIGRRTLENPPADAFGPQVGLAYRLDRSSVIRGGYAISYATVPHSVFGSANSLGFRSQATAVDLTNGRRAAYFLDDGFPQSSLPPQPVADPASGNNTSPAAVTRDRATLPRVQRWSLTLQRRTGPGLLVDVRYAGMRGSRLVAGRNVLGPAANANAPEVLSSGASLLSASAGAGVGGPAPYQGFDGSVAQSLRPFPHVLGIGYLNVPAGNSFHHELAASLERRFSDGAQLSVSYAWSKLTGMGAGVVRPMDGLDHGPQNPTDTHSLERGLSAEDMPHRFRAAFTHAVPLFRRRDSGWLAKLLGGWSVAGFLRASSGTPINVIMANDLEPFLFNGQKRPDILSRRVKIPRGAGFDALSGVLLDRAAFSDPGLLQFGDASRTMDFVRGFADISEDFSFFKQTRINRKFNVRFETRIANAFNRVRFCDPNRNWSAASFGRVFSQCNSPRSIRMGLRMDF